jgi:hypothetical protein
MAFWNRNENTSNLRVIKTARDKESINNAAKNGFYPLIKKVVSSTQISSKYAVFQNKTTGEIKVIGDYRMEYRMDPDSEFEKVIDWTYYYPHQFKSPFAAYLIPRDIKTGERVFIEDLIEDYIGSSWNQGDTYRLESCEAIWNGNDFDIQYDPDTSRSDFVG